MPSLIYCFHHIVFAPPGNLPIENSIVFALLALLCFIMALLTSKGPIKHISPTVGLKTIATYQDQLRFPYQEKNCTLLHQIVVDRRHPLGDVSTAKMAN